MVVGTHTLLQFTQKTVCPSQGKTRQVRPLQFPSYRACDFIADSRLLMMPGSVHLATAERFTRVLRSSYKKDAAI
jgi:hypothetical protein